MCILLAIKKIFKTLVKCCADKRLDKVWHRSKSSDVETKDIRKITWRLCCIYLIVAAAVYACYVAVLHTRYKNKNDVTENDYFLEKAIENTTISINTLGDDFVTRQYELTTQEIVYDEYLPEYCVPNKTYEVKVNKTAVNMSEVEGVFENVRMGGYYIPLDCRPKYRIALMVAFRDRIGHLAIFLRHIHHFLINQRIEYRIFVIEQNGTDPFNQGKLYNVGFKEIQRYGAWHCVILHDVDLLPIDPAIPYACPPFARSMCSYIVERDSHPSLFGGVSVISSNIYQKVNGYSNMYWGWGGEDDDMYVRLKRSKIPVVKYSRTIAKYTSLPHEDRGVNVNRFFLLRKAHLRFKQDGLSNLNYTVLNKYIFPLYTHILADINPEKININIFYKNFDKKSQN